MDFTPSTSIECDQTRSSAHRETEQHVGDNYHGPVIQVVQGGVGIIGGRDHNKIVLPQDADRLLQSLPGWDLECVRFDESKACFSGTRQQLLNDIRQWVQSSSPKRILWVSGGAGTGKSSVAHSCAVDFDKSRWLGASFFFNRDIPKLNTPDYLITNLCYQLAHFDLRLKDKIVCAIQSMGHIPAWSLRSRARKLIVETTAEAQLDKLVVVVIDAVDEAGTTGVRRSLLNSISEEFPNVPDFVKVIITSRDEIDIRASLENRSDAIYIEDADNTEDDIASYIQQRFDMIVQRHRLPRRWPPKHKLEALYHRAGRLFIWASVACNFVDSGRDHIRRLNELLNLTSDQQGTTRPLSTLSSLYNRIFEIVFPIDEAHPADYHYVVGCIAVLQTPLTRIELDSLLGFGPNCDEDGLVLPDGQVIYLSSSGVIIDSLRSILREDTSGYRQTDGPIRLLHPSLYDFLTTYADNHLRINVTKQHQTLAIRCLQVMNSQLKFDICEIGDASLPNTHISETSCYISPGLHYSCFSFVYHLTKVLDANAALLSALREFVWEHILHWIEAMSLLQAITRAEQCLQSLASWMKDQASMDERIEMVVCDTIALLRNYGQGIRLSALNTYYSGLALTPKSRELYKCWFGRIHGIPNVICSHPIWPAASVRLLEGHIYGVEHVVFSPDGQKLASASYDETLRLWDVESGQPIGDALKGHTDLVTGVVFSPDGKKLASASFDKTLRLWDVESIKPIGVALEGHTHRVNRVVFSPDGKKLASASYDNTVRLWDVDNGQPIGDAFEGHTSDVMHIVFSPDGKKLASASNDSTFYLWDVESRRPIGDATQVHTVVNYSIVFSSDGRKLASESWDHTLRLWDVESGQPIGDVLRGHTDTVRCIVFSPNGQRLASASNDNTLRLWDLESGQPIGDALTSHTNQVTHIVFSPDGRKLAWVSTDKSLRLWDVESSKPIGDALTGHTHPINHIVFSPDGKKLVSASHDKTLGLWDLDSDQPISDALNSHTNQVNHLVFSPDRKKLASASSDETLRLWDVESGQPIGDALKGHIESVAHVVFSLDGKKLASASHDHTLRLWDVESGQPIGDARKGHASPINRIVFSPDGKTFASASFDNTLRLWDVDSGQPVREALKGHTDFVVRVVFSPDGKTLATASFDKTLRLWDVASGQPVGDPLTGHTSYVLHIVFSPDGKKLASMSSDNTFLWEVESGRIVNPADYTPFHSTLYDIRPPLVILDSQGYLRHGSKRLMWLPVPLRGCVESSSSLVVVGSGTGAVTFIRWPVRLSSVGMHKSPNLS